MKRDTEPVPLKGENAPSIEALRDPNPIEGNNHGPRRRYDGQAGGRPYNGPPRREGRRRGPGEERTRARGRPGGRRRPAGGRRGGGGELSLERLDFSSTSDGKGADGKPHPSINRIIKEIKTKVCVVPNFIVHS